MPRLLALVAIVITWTAWTAPARAEERPQVPPEVAELYQHKPVVELVTMGVGSLIWERHGHIALCIRYDDPQDDVCYNYGIGQFDDPVGMAWGFFRGGKTFWVGKMSPRSLMASYREADRTIWVQPLPLTDEEEQRVIAKLESDILDANKYYAYDHFWDNCTTRVRDVIDHATDGALSSMKEKTDGKTYRDLARGGFYGMRLPLLITDVAMGRVTDRVPSYWERMFLPQYLREAVTTRWGIEPIVLYQRKGPPPLDSGPSGRVLFALFILAMTAPAWITRLWGRLERTGVALAIVPPALLGLVLWVLAIISPLPYVRYNESCLVFFPFDLLLLFLPAPKRRLYARGRVAMLGLVGFLHLIGVLLQPLTAPLLWPLIPLAVVGFWPGGKRLASRAGSAVIAAALVLVVGACGPGGHGGGTTIGIGNSEGSGDKDRERQRLHPSGSDHDGDGTADSVDQCPDDPEDFDDFQDEDGCPDPDNDRDNILDVDDRCPLEPEDLDGDADEDGCPDASGTYDRDGDGVADTSDKCPDDPEDFDTFEDQDGCPDPDNDMDGIVDVDDLCPNDPEDKDGFQDEDGCPDPDNDADRILDTSDQCPNDPETYNGKKDGDGCPDR